MGNTNAVGFEIGPLLRQAHRKAAEVFDAALQPLQIQGRHFGVLLALHRDGPLTQRQLVDRLGSDKSSMVRTIDDLQTRGLCVREPDASDRRANAIHLTDSGRRLFTCAEQIARDSAATLLAGLTEEEQLQLRNVLARFIAPKHER